MNYRSIALILILTAAATTASAQPNLVVDPASPFTYQNTPREGTHLTPSLASDRAGTWVAVWAASEDLDGLLGKDHDIFFARSTDDGDTWTPPLPLNADAADPVGPFADDSAPDIATDGLGNWVAVWQARRPSSDPESIDYDVHVARSTDNGQTWSFPQSLNANADNDTVNDADPRIVTDANGTWIASWNTQPRNADLPKNPIRTIYVARSTDNGLTWSAPLEVHTHTGVGTHFRTHANLATDMADNWAIVWDSEGSAFDPTDEDADVFISTSFNGGLSWADPIPLNTNAETDQGTDESPSIATDAAGNWITVWQVHEKIGGTLVPDTDIVFARSTDNGRTWTPPEKLNANFVTDTGDDQRPVITTDGFGSWIVLWESDEMSVPPARETAASPFDLPMADLPGPQIGNGVPVTQNPNLIGMDRDIFVAVTTDNGQTWTAPQALNTNARADGSDDDSRPALATDAVGNWIALWQTYRGPRERITINISTARFNWLLLNNVEADADTNQPAPQNGNFCGTGTAAATPFLMLGLSLLRPTTRRTYPPVSKTT